MWERPLKASYHEMVSFGRDIYLTHINGMVLLKEESDLGRNVLVFT